MNRDQLAHVLRSAARIAEDGEILVVGSQSILGTTDASHLPREATMSVEADIAFFNDPDEAKSDLIDGAIGEGSAFHEQFGYYGQGVSIATAVLPDGWRDRLISFQQVDALPSHTRCLDAHDLVVAKLYANREKDREFAVALIASEMIQVRTLMDRVELLDQPEVRKAAVRATIERCAKAAGCG